ncbi:helix-turn-helix domain-containing protein [Streptomyces sp. NPDC086549]|uniref:helix-turn-helix domain-containing protein n=1 Tax=Streptomyces sp. NPDC086549 TaxID=3365752 RepID=UPI003814683D
MADLTQPRTQPDRARVIPLPPGTARPQTPAPAPKEPLWRDLVGDVLRRERRAQERTLKDVADAARISMPYLSEIERGRKEASSEVLAAAAHALGLGLGDLLSRAQGELTRQTGRSRGTSAAPYRGLCLAA